MPLDLLAALVGFVVVMSATPGPNTMLLLASGVNHGFRRTLPHMAGITIGFSIMLLAVGLGVGAVFKAVPELQTALKIASVAYMLWFAWRIASAAPAGDKPVAGPASGRASGPAAGRERPFSFLEAAAFQWINPKAWAIALSGTATYTGGARPVQSLAIMIGVFILVNPPIAVAWTAFGVALRHMLQHPWKLRAFNITMALALVASLWPVIADMR